MRIHTELSAMHIINIANSVPGVSIAHIKRHGSRKRRVGIEVRLWGTSPRRTMSKDGYAATWDEWGVFISKVFEADSDAIVGDYKTRDMFEEITRWRFDQNFKPIPGHAHKWNFIYAYNFECKCGAQMTTEPRIFA